MIHPHDENGDALRRLEAEGDDISRARDIDFTVVFSTDLTAEEFAENFRKAGYPVTIRFTQTKESHPWDVVVVKNMIPSQAGISDFERELQDVADTMGGYNDGWGCFSEPGKHLQ
ncbi:ribonuclease E inhibitor RraB [Edaphobacter sp. HDX4]|uniref:ribonuclease E inhibitor RraB n=1 Tax=Edaphobacter sp. HDX4 TaxID=2794064 RepID=UPI002FE5C640